MVKFNGGEKMIKRKYKIKTNNKNSNVYPVLNLVSSDRLRIRYNPSEKAYIVKTINKMIKDGGK